MKQAGFTIVELLVIIIVISIIAAVTIVSYNSIQNDAHDTAIQSNLDNAAGHLEAYRTSSNNTAQEYPDTTEELADAGITASKNSYNTDVPVNFIYCTSSDRQQFVLASVSKSGAAYLMRETGFQDNSLTANDFTTSLCYDLGFYRISSGFDGGSWQAWVNDS